MELRDWLRAHAEVHEAYAGAKLDGRDGYTRFEAARAAIEHWQRLDELTADANAKADIQARIASLEEIVASAPPPAKARPRPGGRVTFQGTTTVRQLVDFLTGAFGDHGFEFTLDEEAIAAAGVSLDAPLDVQVENASLERLLEAALEPAGLEFRRSGNSFRIGPKAAARPR